jgi:hypothetical protein
MHIPDPREAAIATPYFEPFIKYFSGCSRVIDVASGQGHFLRLLKGAGLNAEGIEIDADLCKQTRNEGLAVTQGNFFEFLKSVARDRGVQAHSRAISVDAGSVSGPEAWRRFHHVWT